MQWAELEKLVAVGESETVEFKKSTAQLTRAGESLCAFLNGMGGRVCLGVTPEGKISGQDNADSTLREVAVMLARFEPPAEVDLKRVRLASGREVLVLDAKSSVAHRPFIFDGRPYQRVGSTTSVMPQPLYQRLLLDRAHAQHRWENAPAIGYGIAELDQEEIFRTVRLGRSAGRMPEAGGPDIGDLLDRMELRKDGQILNAAIVLFGTRFLADYPQCHLRLARFKGTDKTEFLDNRQVHGHAFDLLDESMTFLLRHLPIRGRFERGRLERIDEPIFPPDALREALINALCHRDYSIVGGAVSVAIFDDRVEIVSDGTLPFGLSPADLKREHFSRPRNPYITNVFYRRGLIEQWGRGTNRIVELSVKAGNPEPEFEETAGWVVVRFRPAAGKTIGEVTGQVGTKSGLSRDQVAILSKCLEECSLKDIMTLAGRSNRTKFREQVVKPLLGAELLEMTVPDKPQSRLQKYRLTEKGHAWLATQSRLPGDGGLKVTKIHHE